MIFVEMCRWYNSPKRSLQGLQTGAVKVIEIDIKIAIFHYNRLGSGLWSFLFDFRQFLLRDSLVVGRSGCLDFRRDSRRKEADKATAPIIALPGDPASRRPAWSILHDWPALLYENQLIEITIFWKIESRSIDIRKSKIVISTTSNWLPNTCISECQWRSQGHRCQSREQGQGLFVKDTARVKDVQCKSKSLCRCSVKLCTHCQKIWLTGIITFNAMPHKLYDASNKQKQIILTTSFSLYMLWYAWLPASTRTRPKTWGQG